jgi:hypothetical protein
LRRLGFISGKAAMGLVLGAGLAACGAAGHDARPTVAATTSSVTQSSAPVTSSPQATPTSARTGPARADDAFAGRIVQATGRAARARGAVTVHLRPAAGGAVRPATVVVTGAPCRGRPRCLQLQGTLRGTLTAVRSLPDVGRRFALAARGSLAALGTVSATGTLAAPGNIRAGVETLTLSMRGHAATLMLVARSGAVPGFTGP